MTTRPKFALRLKATIVVATITLGGLAGCGGGSDTVAPVNPPLIGAEDTTGSKVLSWFERAAESLYEISLGAAAMFHGNVKSGLFDVAAGVLGLVGKGLEAGETEEGQAKEITKIDKKIDTLISDVAYLTGHVKAIEADIHGIDAWQKNNAAMHGPMADALDWLTTYYTNPAQPEQSREWVRWYMAGCNYGSPMYVCPSATNPASAARLAQFRQDYVQNPTLDPPTQNSNFPLWWAYSVIGGKNGVATFKVNNTADLIKTQIYHGLIDNMGKDSNGLISYMNLVMASTSCATNIDEKVCNLQKQVYEPLEAYFSLAIGRQSQLVTALAEAKNVLAQKDVAKNGKDVSMLMNDFNQNLNEETEAFLQAAEQIALYRAADGRTDWSNFADTDAGRLLTRADFVVARLTGRNYRSKDTTPALVDDYINPPWPSDGIVGRVFYTKSELIPDAAATRSVCSSVNKSTCSNPLTQISETARPLAITGVQPYLEWTSTLDAKTGAVKLMTGTVTRQWFVQRLTPQPATLTTLTDATPTTAATSTTTTTGLTQRLPVLQPPDKTNDKTNHVTNYYWVNSTKPSSDTQLTGRWPAQLGFYNYDENYTTPPAPDTKSVIPFGSFSSVEGAIGRYGLKLEPNSFIKRGVDMPSWAYDDSYDASEAYPGAAKYYVRYVPNKEWNRTLGGVVGNQAGTWSASTSVQLVNPEGSAINVKVLWPSTIYADLKSMSQCSGAGCAGRDEYYSYVKYKQQILDSQGETMNTGALVNDACHSDPFMHCSIPSTYKAVDANFTVLKTTGTTKLSFKASFSTEVNQYTKKPALFHFDETMRTSIETSFVQWDIQAPLFTVVK